MFLKQTPSSRRPIEPARFVFLPFRKSTQKNEKHKISIDREKTLVKIPHPFIVKTLIQVSVKEIFVIVQLLTPV